MKTAISVRDDFDAEGIRLWSAKASMPLRRVGC